MAGRLLHHLRFHSVRQGTMTDLPIQTHDIFDGALRIVCNHVENTIRHSLVIRPAHTLPFPLQDRRCTVAIRQCSKHAGHRTSVE